MKRDFIISILVSGSLGALIWFFSPYATGMDEPWDAETSYYFVCLFSTGYIMGILYSRQVWAAFLGIVIGQLFYILIFLPLGPLIVIGIPFMFAYGVLALIGAFFGAATIRFLKKHLTGANSRA